MMEAKRWQTVQRVFEEAVEQPTADREAFAEEACDGDRQVLDEVLSLLEADAEAGQRIEQAVEGGEGLLWGGQDTVSEGPRFGKYEVKARIGEGGFGTVYRGRDPVLRRNVAIKTCARPDAAMRRRFFREAQIAAGLQHSNIVTVHELGVEGGVPFLVQELLGGSDLRELIEAAAPLTLVQRLDILLQVARGLAHAHRAGVLHRDVKPANIRVLEDGGVKMLDFGIAKLLDAESQLTGTGTTLGTVGYLAPEQLKSEPIDERADVFAFGVVAYELLTGARPFEGESFSQVSYQLLYVDPEPVESRWPECPPRLANLVQHCLEKEPPDRIRDFVAVIAELEPLLEELDPGSAVRALPLPPPKVAPATETFSSAEAPTLRLPKPPGRKRWQAAAAVAVVGVLAAALALRTPDLEPPPMETALESIGEEAAPSEPASMEPVVPSPLPPTTQEAAPGSESTTTPSEAAPSETEPSELESQEAPERQEEPPPPTTTEPLPPVEPTPVEPQASIEASPSTDLPPAELIRDESRAEPQPAEPAAPDEPAAPVEPNPDEPPSPPSPPVAAVAEEPAPVEAEAPAPTPEPAVVPVSPPTVRRGDLFTAGPGVEPPKLLDQPQPEYPRRARRRGKEARVVVKVLVDEEGKVLQAIAPGDEEGFGKAAREAALKALFEPATRDGIPGKMWRNLPFEFKVQ